MDNGPLLPLIQMLQQVLQQGVKNPVTDFMAQLGLSIDPQRGQDRQQALMGGIQSLLGGGQQTAELPSGPRPFPSLESSSPASTSDTQQRYYWNDYPPLPTPRNYDQGVQLGKYGQDPLYARGDYYILPPDPAKEDAYDYYMKSHFTPTDPNTPMPWPVPPSFPRIKFDRSLGSDAWKVLQKKYPDLKDQLQYINSQYKQDYYLPNTIPPEYQWEQAPGYDTMVKGKKLRSSGPIDSTSVFLYPGHPAGSKSNIPSQNPYMLTEEDVHPNRK